MLSLTQLQREREAVADDHALQALARAAPPRPEATALLTAGVRARTVTGRVQWLHRAASQWAAPLEGVAACKPGCAHCCHIPVAISAVEAAEIGRAARIAPDAVPDAVSTSEMMDRALAGTLPALPGTPAHGYDAPCPFLDQSLRCSIHDHRPLACRVQLNLDVDDLLCRLNPEAEVSVPYADATRLKAYFVAAQPGTTWADIRAFFPRPITDDNKISAHQVAGITDDNKLARMPASAITDDNIPP